MILYGIILETLDNFGTRFSNLSSHMARAADKQS